LSGITGSLPLPTTSQNLVISVTAHGSQHHAQFQNLLGQFGSFWVNSMCAMQSEIQDLLAMARRKPVRTSAILFVQGDSASGVYVVCSGTVRLFIRNPVTGEVTFDRVVAPGSLLGLPAVFGDKPYSMSAEVAQDGEVGFISRERFLEAMSQDGRLCLRCLQLLSEEVRIARGAITGD
jgi:CRP-like cAMP-binding protein